MSALDLIGILQSNKIMTSPEEARAFHYALVNLSSQPLNNELLPALFSVFTDECKHIEVMWGLIHYIESYETESLIRILTDITPDRISNAREWLSTFYVRILNDEEARLNLKRIFPLLANENRDAVYEILTEIAQEPIEDADLVRDIRMKVESVLFQ